MNQIAQTTIALPAFGTFLADQGGHFIDVINVDGQRYGFVSAPKALGELTGEWGKRGEKIDGASHFSDGRANTQAMAAAGSELAQQVLSLDINGQQDWYIPSRDELERLYRRGKPSADDNACWFRNGENPNSIPMGLLYTPEDPPQTPAEQFQSGGAEAMEETWYWSSSQSSAYNAFCQDFDDGYQGISGKDHTLRVRAVRRFLIN